MRLLKTKKISANLIISIITLSLTLLPFMGIENIDQLKSFFQSKEVYAQETIDALAMNSEQRNLEQVLGNSFQTNIINSTTTERFYMIGFKHDLIAEVRVIYKTPDNYAKAFIIKDYCGCFVVNVGPAITFDFKKNLYLNSFDSLDPGQTHELIGHNYMVKFATAPSVIYEEVYTAHPGGYYSYAYGYAENDVPYDDAQEDFKKIKDENNLNDPYLKKFRSKVPVNTVAYWLWDFNGFSEEGDGVRFSRNPYVTPF